MKKILFLIHDLEHGGAEKVLVNLVNNMDRTKFDITVMTLFDVGVNRQFLNPEIKYKSCFSKMIRGNSHIMKLFTPTQLHKLFIKDKYDIEVAYLEGPCARIISGCPNTETKLISWIHCTMNSKKDICCGYRNFAEVKLCYQRIDTTVFVSASAREAFEEYEIRLKNADVLYNTNESEKIIKKGQESFDEDVFNKEVFNWCGVGKLVENKGFDRMINIQEKLIREGENTHLHIIGAGTEQEKLETLSKDKGIYDSVTFWGYQTNPYKYMKSCDLFVCASHSEGFSTATTEALILGMPVCTVEVSGMREMLGNSEYGVIVDNDEESLFKGIISLIRSQSLINNYKEKANQRGKSFSTEKTVYAVEQMLLK